MSVSDEAVQRYLSANFRPDVAADLLVAAQPLMAIAWEEGVEAKSEHPDPANPYRSGIVACITALNKKADQLETQQEEPA